MPSCIFDTCCGCIDLKTGSLIIGYLNLVGEVIFIILGITILTTGSQLTKINFDESIARSGYVFMAIAIILLVLMLFFFAFTIVLLVGIHGHKRGHVKAYLIVSIICLVIATITTLASLDGIYNTADVVCRIVSYIVNVYFLMVIRSYYYQMDDKIPTTHTA